MSEEYKEVNQLYNDSTSSTLYKSGSVKFGITIASYQRKTGLSPFYLKRCLESVLKQTATNWVVYLVGDKYEDNIEFEQIVTTLFCDHLDKIKFANLDVAVERDTLQGVNLWKVAGANAFNTAIQMALNDDCDYILHLDDDDYFHEKKIEILNYVCSVYNNPEYIFHYSSHMHNPYFPLDKIYTMDRNTFLPKPESLIHSSMACHKNIMQNFRYNNKPINNEIDCGDIQLIKYTQHLVKTKNISVIFIPVRLSFHPAEKESLSA